MTEVQEHKCARAVAMYANCQIKISLIGGNPRINQLATYINHLLYINCFIWGTLRHWPTELPDGLVHLTMLLCGQILQYVIYLKVVAWIELGCWKKYLLIPVFNPSNPHEEAYNDAHARTRNPVERSFGGLKMRVFSDRMNFRVSTRLLVTARCIRTPCFVFFLV